MKTLNFMVLRSFIPVFLVALSFFILILEMVDLFGSLWRYLNQNVSLRDILLIQFYYLPKCVSFAAPISVLFSTSYCLGEAYSKNELIAVFGAGIPLARFVLPLLFMGMIISVLGFFFEEHFVIESYKQKNDMVKAVLNESETFNQSNVTVLGENVRTIYHADYYNHDNMSLTGLIVIKRTDKGGFLQRIDAESAAWQDGLWNLRSVRVFTFQNGEISEEDYVTFRDPEIGLNPANFRNITSNISEMRRKEAEEWVETLQKTGLPYREPLTDYYNRYSFMFSPFVVALLSSAIGGRFRKNILLMSLLTSLVFSVVYYVAQLLLRLLAKHGYIPPLAGAWCAFVVFLLFGAILMRNART